MTGLRLFCVSLAALFALSLALGSADAAAKKNKKGGVAEQFKKLDTNDDKKVSREEFAKFGKDSSKAKRTEKLFAKLDTNNDGNLSQDEFAKVAELKKKKK